MENQFKELNTIIRMQRWNLILMIGVLIILVATVTSAILFESLFMFALGMTISFVMWAGTEVFHIYINKRIDTYFANKCPSGLSL